MVLNLKEPITFAGNRYIKANYVIYIDGVALYAGQSRDVLKRVGKHRSMLKHHSQFATRASVKGFDWESSEVIAKIFNIGAYISKRKELESLIHLECETLISKP